MDSLSGEYLDNLENTAKSLDATYRMAISPDVILQLIRMARVSVTASAKPSAQLLENVSSAQQFPTA